MVVGAWYLGEVLYPPLAAFVRTSIAVFLLHIAVEKWHVWVIRFNVVIIWTLSIVYFFRTSPLPRPGLKLALRFDPAVATTAKRLAGPEAHWVGMTTWSDSLLCSQ